MAKNGFIERQKLAKQVYLDVGIQTGRQQIIDMLSLVLRDPEIMKKDTFGKNRLLKVVKGIGDYIDIFQKAWECDDETDYYRAKLDNALSEAYGQEMYDTFLKRYEYLKDFDYTKGRWR